MRSEEMELTLEQKLEIARQVGYRLPYHITNTDSPVDFPPPEEEINVGAESLERIAGCNPVAFG
jgi:hypothetical protein